MTRLTRHICGLALLPDATPHQIELIPVGAFRPADGRDPKVMYLNNAPEVIARSLAAATGGVLPIDFDHRSFAPQGAADSRAAGWITAMVVEGDRVLASVEWTNEGRAALEGRSYRFVSPVFKTRPGGEVSLIEGAGLVNNPALPQLRQLASKDDYMDPINEIAGLLGLSADAPETLTARIAELVASETQLASITQAAGVTAGVSGDDATTQICARLTAKPDPADPDPAKFVPMTAFTALQTQFASFQGDVTAGKAEAALERARAEGKLYPGLEDWATNLASRNLADFEVWAASAVPAVDLEGTRRLAGKAPPTKTDKMGAEDRHVASLMGLSDEAYLTTRNAAAKDT
ncbi:MAG: phage protease [Phaeobacter italicus]